MDPCTSLFSLRQRGGFALWRLPSSDGDSFYYTGQPARRGLQCACESPGRYTGSIQSQNPQLQSKGRCSNLRLGVERVNSRGMWWLTMGYAGSRGAHILVSQVNENSERSPVPAREAQILRLATLWAAASGSFPYALPYQSVNSNNSIGAARYDSLQVKAETKSARHGLYALISYTYSRNFDSGLTDGLGTNPGALYYPLPGFNKLDWGLSQLNLNDNFTASVIYDLPFGKGKRFGSSWSSTTNTLLGHWQVNLIERITSGFPLFVVDSADESGTYFSYNGFTLQRPNEVGNPNQAGPEGGSHELPSPDPHTPELVQPVRFWRARPAGRTRNSSPRAGLWA